jgi:hypothetical protein
MSIWLKIDKFVDEKLVDYVFIVSSSPVLFHDLLEANKQLKERMIPDATQLGYRIHTKHMYIAFFVLIHIVFILPGTAITHALLEKLNCHLSIIAAVIITGLFFTWFAIFRDFMVDKISQKRVREAWKIHFPMFEFDEYSVKVAKIYAESIKKKVSRGELEFFVMSELTKDSELQ